MGRPDKQVSDDPKRLLQFASELLFRHVQSRENTRAWGELSLVLTFERGVLKEVETIDRTRVRADVLGPPRGSATKTN